MLDTDILFTYSDKIGSKLIRKVTGEPVSHCALRIGKFAIHSNFKNGVHIVPLKVFLKDNIVYTRIPILLSPSHLERAVNNVHGQSYDWGAFLYLGLRLLLPSIFPKVNLWQASDLFICTEFITHITSPKADSMITPYKLYEKLLNHLS